MCHYRVPGLTARFAAVIVYENPRDYGDLENSYRESHKSSQIVPTVVFGSADSGYAVTV
jgi:hypothetical protein